MKTLLFVSKWALLCAGIMLLSGCASTYEAFGTGAALALGALEFAVGAGQIDPEAAEALAAGITGMADAAAKAQAGTLSTGETQALVGGGVATALAALRVWRGRPSKGLSKGIQNVTANAKG